MAEEIKKPKKKKSTPKKAKQELKTPIAEMITSEPPESPTIVSVPQEVELIPKPNTLLTANAIKPKEPFKKKIPLQREKRVFPYELKTINGKRQWVRK